jgi:hypothetical protein
MLFALDTTGAARGSWRISNAKNDDWEAMAPGHCGDSVSLEAPATACLYIADVGDNDARRSFVTLYRVREPQVLGPGVSGELRAEQVTARYPGFRADVEAAYVARNGDTFLITKRRMTARDGRLRPALLLRVPADSWGSLDIVPAQLVDSLPIVPGSAQGRQVTDAALSPDGQWLAVRTYDEVFVFAVDPATGRLVRGARWWSCPIGQLPERLGEGVTWLGSEILLTSEGRDAPLHVVSCPPPAS